MNESRNWNTASLFILIFMISATLLFLVALAHYWQVTLRERTDFENNEISVVNQGKAAIQQQLAGVVSDINYLVAYGEHYKSRSGMRYSLFDDGMLPERALTALLKVFSKEKKIYDQIRLINIQGEETLRINYNQGNPVRVATKDLQEKTSRYYFHEVNRLKKGELYISPLDLNMENGEIEFPYKPVLRLGKPVYNTRGVRKGTLLLNFIGNDLLQAFRKATEQAETETMLLNERGYWLSNPDQAKEWGFMLDHGKSFVSHHPAAWRQLNQQHGQFYTPGHLITYTTVSPLPAQLATAVAPEWQVVSLVSQSHSVLKGALNKLALLYGPILLLFAVGSWLLARTINHHRRSELQVTFERRFRQILEHVDLLAVSFSKDGTIIFCNHALTQLLGWNPSEILGENWFEVAVADENKAATKEKLSDIILEQQVIDHEDTLVKTRNGKIRKVEWNYTLMKDPDGETIGITCIGENVTEIRAQESRLRTLSRTVEQSPVMVMIVDTNGGIQYVNPRFSEVTEYTLDEVRGRNPSVLSADSSGSNTTDYEKLWATIKVGRTWHGTFKNKKKNGDIYWAAVSISGLRDDSGKIVNYVGVQEDITERLELEQELAHRNQEIARSKTLAIVGRMASMVAHDLRNPLSSIKMGLQILSKPPKRLNPSNLEAQNKEFKAIALEQVSYMETLLNDLLNYAQPPALRLQWLELDRAINDTINLLQGSIEKHRAKIQVNIQTGLPTIYADPEKLRQIFSNLINNAFHAATESGQQPDICIDIMVRLGDQIPSIQIEISDNGPGIDEHQIEQLFEPFFTTRNKGSGLGLAIVKGYIEQHLGKISIANMKENGGAICTVILPIRALIETETGEVK